MQLSGMSHLWELDMTSPIVDAKVEGTVHGYTTVQAVDLTNFLMTENVTTSPDVIPTSDVYDTLEFRSKLLSHFHVARNTAILEHTSSVR